MAGRLPLSVIQVDDTSRTAVPAGSVGADPVAARADVTWATGARRNGRAVRQSCVANNCSPLGPCRAPEACPSCPPLRKTGGWRIFALIGPRMSSDPCFLPGMSKNDLRYRAWLMLAHRVSYRAKIPTGPNGHRQCRKYTESAGFHTQNPHCRTMFLRSITTAIIRSAGTCKTDGMFEVPGAVKSAGSIRVPLPRDGPGRLTRPVGAGRPRHL